MRSVTTVWMSLITKAVHGHMRVCSVHGVFMITENKLFALTMFATLEKN